MTANPAPNARTAPRPEQARSPSELFRYCHAAPFRPRTLSSPDRVASTQPRKSDIRLFSFRSPEKITFFFNPGYLRRPVKAVLFADDYPNVPLNVDLFASFSIRKLVSNKNYSYPFIKETRQRLDGPSTYSEPSSQVLPLALLQDIYENPTLMSRSVSAFRRIAFFPVLSFDDFCLLSARRTLNVIVKHAQDPDAHKSVLIYSGRWSSLTPSCAQDLAQDILTLPSPSSPFEPVTPLKLDERPRAQPSPDRSAIWALLYRTLLHPSSCRPWRGLYRRETQLQFYTMPRL